MNLTTLARSACVAVLLGVVALGCSSSNKKSSATTTTLPVETKGFAVETPEGQTSLSLDGLLPPNWPSNFPVAPKAKAAGSGSLGGTSSGSLVGVYSTTKPPEDAYRFYASTDKYKIDSRSSVGTGSVFLGTVTFSGKYTGSANIVSKNNKTYIVVVLRTPGTGSTTTTAP
jgi:hypothetical protein